MALILITLTSSMAQARVFDFKEEWLSSYLHGTFGQAAAGQKAFAPAEPNLSYNDQVPYVYSGEIGFMLKFDRLAFRLGVEAIQAKPLKEMKATNAGGSELFGLESKIFVFNPVATLEFRLMSAAQSRAFFYFGVGMADVTVENHYTFTDAGRTAYGLNDYAEKANGGTTSYRVGLGFETLFTDNVTVTFDFGYRHLPVTQFKHKNDVASLPQPTASKGDVLLNADGGSRSIDMSGIYGGMGFRFYIDFL